MEGPWAALKSIDRECGETTINRSFQVRDNPEQNSTVTHDIDMKLNGWNVYTFTRLEASDSFFVVVIDQENNLAMASLIRIDPQTEGDTAAFRDSIEFQSQMGITLPEEGEIKELCEIVTAFSEGQIAEIADNMEDGY